MGILDDLKKEADEVRLNQEAEAARQRQLEATYMREMRPRLLSIHRYLSELAEQLTTLPWSISAAYDLPAIGRIDGLRQENYRIHMDNRDRPKKILFSFVCRAQHDGRYTVVREKTEAAEQFFASQHIRFSEAPIRDAQGLVRQVTYQAQLQVLVSIICLADIPQSRITVVSSNMEGMRPHRFDFDFRDVNEQWLDRMGMYVLRKLDTIAKPAISEPERQALKARLAAEKARLQRESEAWQKHPLTDEGVESGLLRSLRRKLLSLSD